MSIISFVHTIEVSGVQNNTGPLFFFCMGRKSIETFIKISSFVFQNKCENSSPQDDHDCGQ